ncbi:MAG: gamma-glutamylcyclotransferase [Candidatus Bathyarchaeota archaeon]|nr:gamma-glutamylcyclotransferase [Candidatus Bathyarchaeota archaeon]
MVKVWQYGSNMHEKRINQRLKDAARFAGLAIKRGYKLAFTHTNKDGVGVSDVVKANADDYVIGCLFEIPEDKMPSLDSFEGAHSKSYKRIDDFVVIRLDDALNDTREKMLATTYVVVNKEERPRTNSKYANHILKGIREHKMGVEYFIKVRGIILENNPNIEGDLICYSHC